MKRFGWIVAGALVIGTLDAAFAIVFWGQRGVGPIRIFQTIAAGLLGRAAFSGGLRSESLGVALHYFIAIMIVFVYWLAIRIAPALAQRTILYGAIYGVCVYLVMNYLVIPLSATSRSPFNLSWVAWSVIVHAFLIGVPAAYFAGKAHEQDH